MYQDSLYTTSKKRVFLTFASEDLDHVRGLRLLKDNPNFDLEFYDQSLKEAIDSERANYVKQVIRDQIKRASVTACLISETTYQSRWVEWELETSHYYENKILAMALKGIESATLPKFIKDNEITFWSWDPEYLGNLIKSA